MRQSSRLLVPHCRSYAQARSNPAPVLRTGLLLPGQGSQYPKMGESLYTDFKEARDIFERANEALGFKLTDLLFKGTDLEISQTEVAQPAILTHSVAALEVLKVRLGWDNPDCLLGHSLGEFTALTAAGGLSFEDAVKLVRKRGEYMKSALDSADAYAMVVVFPLFPEEAQKVAELVRQELPNRVCDLAIINGASHIVFSGHEDATDRATELAKEKFGARKSIPLDVYSPFHSSLMRPVAELLRKEILALKAANKTGALKAPVVTNYRAVVVSSIDEALEDAIEQTHNPIQFYNCLKTAVDKVGVTRMIEVGPWNVLSGLSLRAYPGVPVATFDKSSDLIKVEDFFKKTSATKV